MKRTITELLLLYYTACIRSVVTCSLPLPIMLIACLFLMNACCSMAYCRKHLEFVCSKDFQRSREENKRRQVTKDLLVPRFVRGRGPTAKRGQATPAQQQKRRSTRAINGCPEGSL